MLDREGASGPADVGLFGARSTGAGRSSHELAQAGVTEFSAALPGRPTTATRPRHVARRLHSRRKPQRGTCVCLNSFRSARLVINREQ